MNLAQHKISTKVMLVIALMSVMALIIAAAGVFGLSAMHQATIEVDAAGDRATLAARARSNAVNLNRWEYRLAAFPYGEGKAAATAGIKEQREQFELRMSQVEETLPESLKPEFDAVMDAYTSYSAEVDVSIRKANELEAANVPFEEARTVIAEEAGVSSKLATALEDVAKVFIDASLEQGAMKAAEAGSLYMMVSIAMIVAALMGIAVAVVIGRYISSHGIVRPIEEIVRCLQALAGGNLDTTVFGVDRKDEVGSIAATTQVFKDNLVAAQRMREDQEQARQARERRQAVVDQAVQRFSTAAEQVVNSVASASTELQAAADTLSQSATEAAQQATTVAVAAEQTSSNVNSVASATEELAASVREIGVRAQQAHGITQSAVAEVSQTNAMVKDLEQAATKIGAVVELIGEIASQTNLLALNATIEAARAGEAGRGFAVVAAEVKALAEQCATASDEIQREIGGMQEVTRSSVTAMQSAGERIGEISTISSNIAAAVQQQGAATAEISRNVQQASTGTSEVTRNISSVSTAAGDTGAAASQVQAAAAELARHSATLDREFSAFVEVIRAA